ncbi:unnamed protein product, partial [Prorocentrum cordatum]
MTNQSAGCSILLSSYFDILAITAYFPPPQRHQVDSWKATVAKLTQWIHQTVQTAKRRALVLIGADTKSGFGKTAVLQGMPCFTADDLHKGRHQTAFENYTTSELWRVMRMEGLSAVDAFFATGLMPFPRLHFEPPQEVEPRWDYDQVAALLQPEGGLTFAAEMERLSERHAGVWKQQ